MIKISSKNHMIRILLTVTLLFQTLLGSFAFGAQDLDDLRRKIHQEFDNFPGDRSMLEMPNSTVTIYVWKKSRNCFFGHMSIGLRDNDGHEYYLSVYPDGPPDGRPRMAINIADSYEDDRAIDGHGPCDIFRVLAVGPEQIERIKRRMIELKKKLDSRRYLLFEAGNIYVNDHSVADLSFRNLIDCTTGFSLFLAALTQQEWKFNFWVKYIPPGAHAINCQESVLRVIGLDIPDFKISYPKETYCYPCSFWFRGNLFERIFVEGDIFFAVPARLVLAMTEFLSLINFDHGGYARFWRLVPYTPFKEPTFEQLKDFCESRLDLKHLFDQINSEKKHLSFDISTAIDQILDEYPFLVIGETRSVAIRSFTNNISRHINRLQSSEDIDKGALAEIFIRFFNLQEVFPEKIIAPGQCPVCPSCSGWGSTILYAEKRSEGWVRPGKPQ